jgi:hypothetical protein
MSVGILKVLPNGNDWVRLPDRPATRILFQRGDYQISCSAAPAEDYLNIRSVDGPLELNLDESGNCNAFWVRAQLDGPIVVLWQNSNLYLP